MPWSARLLGERLYTRDENGIGGGEKTEEESLYSR